MTISKFTRKICAVAIAAVMAASGCLTVSAAEKSSYIRGTFTFSPHNSTHDLKDTYIYSDRFFDGSAYEADHHLAIASMILASTSISSEDVDYPDKSRNLRDFLDQIGFKNIQVNQDYKEKMQMNSMGAAAAYKELDSKTVLLAIVPRSAAYEAEWGGNFNVGESGLHAGFKTGRDIVLDFAKQYVAENKSVFEGKTVKVWTAGYSRGAGVANLTGAALVEDPKGYIGLTVKPENVYDYAFGTPLTASTELGTGDSKYNNIHNYVSDYDPVSMLPFAQWGFGHYGEDVALDVHNAETKAKMLEYLKNTNSAVYDVYTTSEDPDNYQAMTVGVTDSGSIGIVPDTTRSITQKEALTNLSGYLTGTAIKTRAVYAEEYQGAVTEAASLLIGGADEDVAKFMQGAVSCKSIKPLAVMLFFYSWVEQYVDQTTAVSETTTLSDDWKDKVMLPEPVTGEEDKTGNDTADKILGSDEYKDIYEAATSENLAEQAAQYGIDIDSIKTYGDLLDLYKQIAGKLMKDVLTDGLKAMGYSDDAAAKHSLIQGNNPTALSVVAAQVLFGTTDKLTIEGAVNKVKNAATLLGNSSYMRVHNNEVILSWLRAMDKDPIDDDTSDAPVSYTIKGADKWTKGSKDGLKLTADSGVITGVRIDGTKTDKYTIGKDKRSVVLKASLLETLSTGKHTVTVLFEDGEGTHDFRIVEAGKTTDTSENVKTGDTTDMTLWLILMAAAAAGAAAVYGVRRRTGR